ncbi:MAG: 5-formyltetrahydrofolate cyclo-ligase [Planctomycetes bacterium]|nr:5-formyltetrahydrofolate cyclo-ligase [Planctomycetota bacterium]
MNPAVSDFQARKQVIREQAHANRNALAEKDALSKIICDKFMALPAYAAAKTVMFYIDVRSEVRTRHALPEALASGKKIIVPWCNEQGELELFHLTNMDELAVGMYKILEPKPELRRLPEKIVGPTDLDIVMVPGVAFDRRGARMGHGKGYYDKLLQHARKETPLIALAFECQFFPEIPTAGHDIFMDFIITEAEVYTGKGRGPH